MEETGPTKSHKRPKTASKAKPILVGLVVVVVLASLSFYAGMQYQKGHQKTAVSANYRGGGRFGGGFGGGNFQDRVIGQVTAVSASSISVDNSRTNATTTLTINSSTQISNNGQTASASSIQVGDTVFITEDSSNTSIASRILLNPSFGGFGGPSSNSNNDLNTSPSNTTLN